MMNDVNQGAKIVKISFQSALKRFFQPKESKKGNGLFNRLVFMKIEQCRIIRCRYRLLWKRWEVTEDKLSVSII